MPRITLLTDFGTRDGYVGAMKGVMASVFPGVTVDDISHSVAPGDVEGASLSLTRYWDRYPSGTVHVVVVDPGVGTDRRPLAVEADRKLLVAPDNGVLSGVLESGAKVRVVKIENVDYLARNPSATFHGRDVFAPAAAFLARGVHISRLGSRVSDPIRLAEPEVEEDGEFVSARVVSMDRFGNLITNLRGAGVEVAREVEVDGQSIPVVRTYGDVDSRSLAAVVNSDGRLEVAARDASAADLLDAGIGTRVRIRVSPEGAPAQGLGPMASEPERGK